MWLWPNLESWADGVGCTSLINTRFYHVIEYKVSIWPPSSLKYYYLPPSRWFAGSARRPAARQPQRDSAPPQLPPDAKATASHSPPRLRQARALMWRLTAFRRATPSPIPMPRRPPPVVAAASELRPPTPTHAVLYHPPKIERGV